MDIAFYNRGGRGIIKHKAAAAGMPAFYPRSPAVVVVAPAAAAVPYSAVAPWPAPAPPPSAVTVGHGGGHAHAGGGDADVDRRAAMYISRVQERLRRERVASEEYWRKRY
uniref:Uncharacterized protein n=1 Tax=Oryza punctata TaxID=4537 RepID=A0A0E0KPT4_ORYPU